MKRGLFVLFLFVVGLAGARPAGNFVRVDKRMDLSGDTLRLSPGTTLWFGKKGSIENGTIVGKGTGIGGKIEGIFRSVTISGDWNVPQISSAMFSDAGEENGLVQVFALAHPDVQNVITIAPGHYDLVATDLKPSVLKVVGNTEVVVDGQVELKPNSLSSYKMFDVRGNHIFIHGNGIIIGDKEQHTGSEGEWGMGISIQRSNDVRIEDLTIRDCWGDCIYICKRSDQVSIRHCRLVNGRRQGISITGAGRVYISDCDIRDVHGTNPQYGIDVEPNRRDTVDYVQIRNVRIVDCRGGITVSCSPTKECKVYRIEVDHCSVSGCVERYAYKFSNTDTVSVKNCVGVKRHIRFKGIGHVTAINNQVFNLEDKKDHLFSRCGKVVRK